MGQGARKDQLGWVKIERERERKKQIKEVIYAERERQKGDL